MSVDQKHPLYTENLPDWELMRDSYKGEKAVKAAGFKYLAPTSGMRADGIEQTTQEGYQAYKAYQMRAHYPDIVREAVEAAIGVMHQKPPVIELPEAMEPMREKATLRNESLNVLLRRINTSQLICGRLGLLVDFPDNTRAMARDVEAGVEVQSSPAPPAEMPTVPYIALYECEKIINWDYGYRDGIGIETLNMVALDETQFERQDDFTWQEEKKYRVLTLGNLLVNQLDGQYQVGVFRDDNTEFSNDNLITPSFRGNTLSNIPFTVINSKDVVPAPDDPPLLGLANLVMSIYRQDADYKQTLFMQGQDTLVVIGGTSAEGVALRVGAGGRIDVPVGGDAKFEGVDSKGLEEQRASLENDKGRASEKGGQLLDSVSRERESGEALTVRVAARTASLKQVALAGAFGLEQTLKDAARWIGADPDAVKVTPNLDFVSDIFAPSELVELMTAKMTGAPLADESIHAWLRKKDVTELEYEEEIRLIEGEEPRGMGSSNPEDLEDDEDPNDNSEGDEDDEGDADEE